MTSNLPSRDEVQRFLDEAFPPPAPPGTLRGRIREFLVPPRNRPTLASYPFEPIDLGGDLPGVAIFRATVEGDHLQRRRLPSGTTFGVLSYDGSRIRLHSRETAASTRDLLRAANRDLAGFRASAFADFLFEVFLAEGATSSTVLPSLERLRAYAEGEGSYEFEAEALAAVEEGFVAPEIAGDADAGWRVRFSTLRGWMHEVNDAGLETFRVDPSFEVTHEGRTPLANPLFATVPRLAY